MSCAEAVASPSAPHAATRRTRLGKLCRSLRGRYASNKISRKMRRRRLKKLAAGFMARLASFACALAMTIGTIQPHASELNDYPTDARADYVFACMKTNGETRQALEQCSCAIDVIASILPYDRYVSAETVLSLSQVPGRFGTMFQSPEQARSLVADLQRAQAEARVRCF